MAANADAAFGLKPIEHFNGHPWNGAVRTCYKSATAGALYIGTPVRPNGTGSDAGLMEIQETTAGDGNSQDYTMLGPIVAIEPQPSNLDRTYIATGDTGNVYVCVDPWVLYEVQCAGTLAKTDLGDSGNLSGSGGSTVTGLSSVELSASAGGASDGGDQVLIVEFIQREDNDISEANGNWKVLNNRHSFRAVDADLGNSYVGAVGV